MVFVKVRETYDLHTTRNKMTVIGIHTPKPDIIKRNYPGLLIQCRAYRPVSADVRIACASVLPLDPKGVGTAEGDVAPEDVFNPILYKAMSNKGMSQLEARINSYDLTTEADVNGSGAMVDVDSLTNISDEFGVYYSLLSNTHDWKHASVQSGLSMNSLRPLVYEINYNVGDSNITASGTPQFGAPNADNSGKAVYAQSVLGSAKPFPFLPCTMYTGNGSGVSAPSNSFSDAPSNNSTTVPWLKCYCGVIIIPPSRLHELFFRMVVEWTLEFSTIRSVNDVTNFQQLGVVGAAQHFQNYTYSSTKEAVTGDSDSILESDSCMVSSNVDVNKVM